MTFTTIRLNGERQSGNTTMGLAMLAAVRKLGHRAVVVCRNQASAQWIMKYRGVPSGSALWPACIRDNSGAFAHVRAVMIDDSELFKPEDLSECLEMVKRAFDCLTGPLQLIIVGQTPAQQARLDALYEALTSVIDEDRCINLTGLHDYLAGEPGVPADAIIGDVIGEQG